MSKHWIWAGGFLALAFGGIGFGAKAGVESGLEALRVERARVDSHHGHANNAKAGKAHAAVEKGDRPADHGKPAHAHPPQMAEARLDLEDKLRKQARAVMAPALARDEREAPRPAGRLYTPASEIDIAFATGRIDRIEPRREAKVVEAVTVPTPAEEEGPKPARLAAPEPAAPSPEDGAEAPSKEEAPLEPSAEEAPPEPSHEEANRAPSEAEAPTQPAEDTTSPTGPSGAKPADEAPDEGEDTSAALVPAPEGWDDETEADAFPYAARIVDVFAFGRAPARI